MNRASLWNGAAGKECSMRRWMVSLVAAALVAVSLTIAGATPPSGGPSPSGSPGPNGHNDYGLCNAYGNGSPVGQAEKQAHGAAFLGLEATATAWDASSDGPSGGDDGVNGDAS